jgi:arylsulfatase A-like enzyme
MNLKNTILGGALMLGAANALGAMPASKGSSADTGAGDADNGQTRRNVLFIICDDLRPELGCYGQKQIHSPHIDSLAAAGVRFDRAYCNIAVSGASRASLLTGLRPTRTTLSAWNARTDVDAPDAVTLQQCFRDAGYVTVANGKVYHHQDEASMVYWDRVMPPDPITPMDFHSPDNIALMDAQKATGKGLRGYFYEHTDTPDSAYIDARIADRCIADLHELKASGKPFMMAAGFIRPHLPFTVPQRYWDLYDHDSIKIPDNYVLLPGNDIPERALANWSELRAYSGIPSEGPLDEATAKLMIHGYYAAVSFVDAQIGRLLDALRAEGLADNTTIVLIGDHGWNLGEHGTWCKHSIMNTCLHSALIIASPDVVRPHVCSEVVEFVDLYPTLCASAGITPPAQLEGSSLVPLLRSESARTKGYAVARWANGFTLVEDDKSYTEWWDKEGRLIDRMLFDHTTDADENYNVASRPDRAKLVKQMSRKLRRRRGARYDQ